MDRFSQCLAFELRPDIEGGYVDNPADPGGPTNHGITQRVYSAWLARNGCADADVRYISYLQTAAIYQQRYWGPTRCDQMDAPLDLVVFDGAVQHGVMSIVRILQQRVLGFDPREVDGIVGPSTLAAIDAEPAVMLASKLIEARRMVYAAIVRRDPTQAVFAHGWSNRMTALAGAAGTVTA